MAVVEPTPVTFSIPPPKRRGTINWEEVAKLLESKPGEWALIGIEVSSGIPIAIRQGRLSAMKTQYGYEVTTRNNTTTKPRTCDVYVRYIPERDIRKWTDTK